MLIGLGANAILVALGDTKSYRNILIIGFILNVILNPMFIYGFYFIPALGISGVAIATVLIQCITLLYMLFKLSKTDLFSMKHFISSLPNIKAFKHLINQAIPTSINMFLGSLGRLLCILYRLTALKQLPLLELGTEWSKLSYFQCWV